MNTKELELKVKEILEEENFFEMILKAQAFESEYKKTDFFKVTKMPLLSVIEKAKVFYTFNWNEAQVKLQNLINNLDLSRINELADQFGTMLANDNAATMENAKEFADLIAELKGIDGSNIEN